MLRNTSMNWVKELRLRQAMKEKRINIISILFHLYLSYLYRVLKITSEFFEENQIWKDLCSILYDCTAGKLEQYYLCN